MTGDLSERQVRATVSDNQEKHHNGELPTNINLLNYATAGSLGTHRGEKTCSIRLAPQDGHANDISSVRSEIASLYFPHSLLRPWLDRNRKPFLHVGREKHHEKGGGSSSRVATSRRVVVPLARIIAGALMAAGFAIILGAFMRRRRDDRRKQEKLSEAAKSDGRYIAQNIDEFRQPQAMSPGVVPADTRELLKSLLSEITQSIRKG